MPKNKNGEAKHFMGPYETWVLGLGRKYLKAKRPSQSSARKPDGGAQYAAFATFSEAVTSAEIVPMPAGSQKFRPPSFPTIWTPKKGELAKYTAFPLIVQVSGLEHAQPRQLEIDGIGTWFNFAENGIRERGVVSSHLAHASDLPTAMRYGKKGASPDSVAKSPITDADAVARAERQPEPGLRLNVPIAVDTLDTDFSQQPVKIAASKGVRARGSKRPKIVIMAVIDDGIAFAHSNFRDASGASRVESCWLQSAKPDPEGARSVAFGRELFAGNIDTLLKEAGNDEAAVYAGIGVSEEDIAYGNPWRRFSTHGTHVLDIAAGHRHGAVSPSWPVPEEGDLDAVRIIAVQLPPSAIANTAGFGKDAYVLSAFHHIFQRADEIFEAYDVQEVEDQVLIVNFSFGITAGTDDGTNPVARAICELIELRTRLGKPTYVTMPAGNTFSSALYGEVTGELLNSNGEYAIPWRIQPDSRTSNHLELWFRAADVCEELAVLAPDGREAFVAAVNGTVQDGEIKLGKETFGLVGYSKNSGNLLHAVVSLAPTDPEDVAAPATQAGLWQIRLKLKATGQGDGPLVRCRIQRNDSPYGYRTGARQSYFDDPADERFGTRGELSESDCPSAFVRRFGSLNGWAIGNGIWIVGGIAKDREKPSAVSAAGRLAPVDGNLAYVDIGAPSDDSRHLPGRLAAGTISGSVARISGTSVAAPYAARTVALTVLAGARPQRVGDLKGAKAVQGNQKKAPYTEFRLGDFFLT